MKILSVVFFCLLVFTFGTFTAFGQTEKQNVIAAARSLEAAPLDEHTSKISARALRWAIETDEIHLVACGGIFSMFSDKKNKQSSLMTMGYTVGMAAHRIENPS